MGVILLLWKVLEAKKDRRLSVHLQISEEEVQNGNHFLLTYAVTYNHITEKNAQLYRPRDEATHFIICQCLTGALTQSLFMFTFA